MTPVSFKYALALPAAAVADDVAVYHNFWSEAFLGKLSRLALLVENCEEIYLFGTLLL